MNDVARTLDDVVAFIRRYVHLTATQADTLALWTFHTHAIEAATVTPYIAITSAEKRSGKSLTLEVEELLVRSPLSTANISDAAMYRVIAERTPTLFLDEVDAIFGPKARDREDLRGILNAGFRRGAVVHRMGGPKMTTLDEFPVFSPKAFAGIGDCLPDTLLDRSIRIRLERKTRDEKLERFRRRDVEDKAEPIRESLATLAEHHTPALADARPHLPDELDDRAQDAWEALLAIADLAGGDWPTRARGAALALSTGEQREDESLGARLLKDIYDVFVASDDERIKTADLIAELSKVEEQPWGDWKGNPITAQALSRLLKPYRIRTMAVWSHGETVRGYKREQFWDAWVRVLGVSRDSGVSPGSRSQAAPNGPDAPNAQDAWRPTVGNPGYLLMLDTAYSAGHLTDAELVEQQQLHRFVRGQAVPEAEIAA
jgi:hypothetical protein